MLLCAFLSQIPRVHFIRLQCLIQAVSLKTDCFFLSFTLQNFLLLILKILKSCGGNSFIFILAWSTALQTERIVYIARSSVLLTCSACHYFKTAGAVVTELSRKGKIYISQISGITHFSV